MKRKALIHIGGSPLQLRSIKWALSTGLAVLLTDLNPRNPGRGLADEYAEIDGEDLDALTNFAERMSQKYELAGVYCSSDFGLRAVAWISEKYDLPANNLASVKRALGKSAAREVFEEQGIPVPRGQVAVHRQDIERAVSRLGLPLVVKPAGSSGSRGVRSVRISSEIPASFQAARPHSSKLVVEEYLTGRHLDVNGIWRQGQFSGAGILERFFSDPPFHYPVWGCCPPNLNSGQTDQLYELLRQASLALELTEGPVKADLIWSESRGPVVLEVAPRFHGDVSTSFVLPLVQGRSPIQVWFADLAKRSPPPPSTGNALHVGWLAIFPEEEGVLKSIENISQARNLEGIEALFIGVEPGKILRRPQDNTDAAGFVWARADSRAELRKRLFAARETIQLVMARSERHGF